MTHRHRHKYSFGVFLHDIGPGTKGTRKLFDKGLSVSGRVAVFGVHSPRSPNRCLRRTIKILKNNIFILISTSNIACN